MVDWKVEGGGSKSKRCEVGQMINWMIKFPLQGEAGERVREMVQRMIEIVPKVKFLDGEGEVVDELIEVAAEGDLGGRRREVGDDRRVECLSEGDALSTWRDSMYAVDNNVLG